MCVDELRERFVEDTGESIVRWDGLFNPNYGYWLEEVIIGAKNTKQQVQADNSCEHSFSPVYQCVHCGKIGDSIA